MAMSGLPPAGIVSRTSQSDMPYAAAAALARILAVKRLTPMMSLTENIMVMSLMPTNADVSPEATVDTMILGKP